MSIFQDLWRHKVILFLENFQHKLLRIDRIDNMHMKTVLNFVFMLNLMDSFSGMRYLQHKKLGRKRF